jgi:hypothetical protein
MGSAEIARIFQPIANGAIEPDVGKADTRQNLRKQLAKPHAIDCQKQRRNCCVKNITDHCSQLWAGLKSLLQPLDQIQKLRHISFWCRVRQDKTGKYLIVGNSAA